MEGAANRSADVGFVARALSRGVSRGLRQAFRGDAWGAARAASILAGIVLAGSGHVAGAWQWRRSDGDDRARWPCGPRPVSGSERTGEGCRESENFIDSSPGGEQYHKLSLGRQEWLQNR